MKDKTYNLIATLCFGHPLAKETSFIKPDIWDYEPGLNFFISFFMYDLPSGNNIFSKLDKHFIPMAINSNWSFKH